MTIAGDYYLWEFTKSLKYLVCFFNKLKVSVFGCFENQLN